MLCSSYGRRTPQSIDEHDAGRRRRRFVNALVLTMISVAATFQSSAAFDPVPSWSAESDQSQAYFGMSLSDAGDVNGDGFGDLVVGSPWYSDGQQQEGAAFLYLGSTAGLSASPDWTGQIGQSWSWFGEEVAGAGDVDGDGYDDILVGAFGYDNGDDMEGGVFLFRGSPNGPSLLPDWSAEGNSYRAQFGGAIAAAGDVDGDGYADIVVGARLLDRAAEDGGAAFLYSGGPSGLSSSPTWSFEGDQFEAYMGHDVEGAGDVNGDGYDDLLVSATGYDLAQFDEGAVFLFYGSSLGPSTAPNWIGAAGQFDAHYGSDLGGIGDVNGDGYDDIAVGASGYDDTQQDEGAVFIYLGSASGPSSVPDWTATLGQFEAQISTVDGVGDVNEDGYDDVLIGGPGFDSGEEDEGGAFLYLGSADGPSTSPAWSLEGGQYQALLGKVTGAGDVNGDGADDFAVGAPFYDGGEMDEGKVFAYRGVPAAVGVVNPAVDGWLIATRPTPNPASSHVSLFVQLDRSTAANVRIMDAAGRAVRTLPGGVFEPGRHRIDWDLRNEQGRRVPSGVYFVAVQGPEGVVSIKTTIVR